jgi:hypothetical protein
VYWILFWPFVTLAASRSPIWVALMAVPAALLARLWYQFGVIGRPPERGACATLGLLDLGIVGIGAMQKALAKDFDASVLRAGVGLAIVLWMALGLPTPRLGLPTRGKHARRLIALLALALVVSAAVEWLGAMVPGLTKSRGTGPFFWPLFLAPLPFYLTPLWSVLSDGWRVHNTPPHSPGLSELWELSPPDDNRVLNDRERLLRAILQAEPAAYLILLNRLDDPRVATSRIRAAEEELFRRGEHPPLNNPVKWATERLVQVAMSADSTDPDGRLLLRDALDALPPESQRVLSPWLVGGASFAELLATTGLSSSEVREQLLEGLNLLTEAAYLRLRGDSSVVTSLGLPVRG